MANSSQNTQKLADQVMFQTYGRLPITLLRGQGCLVWDETGKQYVDFIGGIAVCALGHSSPLVTLALEEQSKTLVHVSNLFYTQPQTELAQILVQNSFADRVFFANSGAEANEAAIKLARRYAHEKHGPDRHVIVTMENSFHGRTMATLSATGQKKVRTGYDPLLSGFRFVPFNNAAGLRQAIDPSVCAVLLEPIQGEGGVICPDQDYLREVAQICDEYDLILIFDEIQVGMGRTGKLFAHEHYGITPHIMTLAKALANGLPIGAMLATEKLAGAFGPGSHASTFGGTPLITAVAKAVLSSLINDGWIDHCRDMGDYFKGKLAELAQTHSCVKEVRGKGLILGMELNQAGGPVVNACIEEGFLINCAQEKVLRFLPPLVIGREEIDSLIEVLNKVLGTLK